MQPDVGAAGGRRLRVNEQRDDRPAGDPPSILRKVPWSPMNLITLSMNSYDIHMNFNWFLSETNVCAGDN